MALCLAALVYAGCSGAAERAAFNGLALVIVRAERGQSGEIIVTAKSNGLEEARTRIAVKESPVNQPAIPLEETGLSRPPGGAPDDAGIFAPIVCEEDPNYVDLGFANIAGIEAQDFDLVAPDSPAVDAGADIVDNTLDYFNRLRPIGSAPDIGALEFGSGQAECIPRFPAISIQPRFDPARPAMDRRRAVERTSRP